MVQGENTIAEYLYDALGRRIQKQYTQDSELQTVNYYYDGSRIVEEYNGTTLIAQYIYGISIDEILRMDVPTGGNTQHPVGGTFYYHENAAGSIYTITDGSGGIIESYSYTAYGEVTIYDNTGTAIGQSTIGNTRLFTGREYDAEIELYYYRARHYSAELGRFLQRDPAEDDSLANLYAYCANNPMNLVDPLGTAAKNSPLGQDWNRRRRNLREEPAISRFLSNLLFGPAGHELIVRPEYRINDPQSLAFLQGTRDITIGGAEFAGSVLNEGMDWVLTIKDASENGVNWTHFIGLAPLVPGTIRNIGKLGKIAGELPCITNPALRNITETMFKKFDNIPGGTAGAVEYELRTGEKVGNTFHSIAAKERITRLNKILKTQELTSFERATAEKMLKDLKSALKTGN